MSRWRHKKRSGSKSTGPNLCLPSICNCMANINRAHLRSLSTVTALNVFPQGSVAPCALRLPADSPLMWRDLKRFPCFFASFFSSCLCFERATARGFDHTVQPRLTCHDEAVFRQEIDLRRNQNKCSSAFIFFPLRFFSLVMSFSTNKSLIFYKAGFFFHIPRYLEYMWLERKQLASINVIWPPSQKRK